MGIVLRESCVGFVARDGPDGVELPLKQEPSPTGSVWRGRTGSDGTAPAAGSRAASFDGNATAPCREGWTGQPKPRRQEAVSSNPAVTTYLSGVVLIRSFCSMA